MKRILYSLGVIALLLLTTALPAQGQEGIELTPLGTYETGVYDEGAAEIAAYHPATQRLFVINSDAVTLDILDISNPANPTLVDTIDVTEFGASANSVAIFDNLVAVAVESDPAQDPGMVVFLDTAGNLLNSVEVGALPDMVTFTPNGQKVLVANEGEPSDDYTVDPEGSVSVIDVSNGLENATVATASFAPFNAQAGELAAAGLRLFGPNASLAQDVEPEYIAVSPDSATAYITLQENNAVAVVDVNAAQVSAIVPLGTKDHSASLQTFNFTNLPVLGTTAAGQPILLGGFSGLYFDGVNPDTGALQFLAHPDRGPNAEPIDTDGDGVNERPFPLPDYQARILRLEVIPGDGVQVVEEILLTRADGTPITGLPNLAGEPGLANADEIPIDLLGNALELDPYGADLEGIVRAADNSYWLVDEYRPAINHFDESGALIDRFVPQGAGSEVGTEALPAVLGQRRANRGFEAVALEGNTLYAFVQSPLDNPDVADDANSKASQITRIVAFDTASGSTVGQYAYVLEGGASDKIGDAVALGNGEFLVIERDSAVGPEALKKVFIISLDGATNLNGLEIAGPGGALESLAPDELAEAGVTPVGKALHTDLVALGYLAGDKPEGLALIDENRLAVLNDNDFQLTGNFDPASGLLEDNPAPVQPVLGIITLNNPMDVSNEDGMINITSWPTLGLYQPDAIAAYSANGQTYLVTANEGDTRDYEGYSEEARVADLELDPQAFPDAATLQQESALGRLLTSVTLGDTDLDGDVDQIYSMGARSFSIWDASGNLVYDSGADFEKIVAQTYPAHFNDSGENGFDNRSDDKGPEPEGVVIGEVGGSTYAFIGLERIGGVMVYDISNPAAPQFVTYANNRNFDGNAEEGTAGDIGPEGLVFISAADSLTGQPLLVVANEVSGSTTVYQISGVPAMMAEAETPAETEAMAEGEESEAMAEEDGQMAEAAEAEVEGVLIKNFAGDELTFTFVDTSYTISNNEELRLPLVPGFYTFTASTPQGGAVSSEFDVLADTQTELSIFLNENNRVTSYVSY